MRLHTSITRTVLVAAILPLVAGCPQEQVSEPDSPSSREVFLDLSCEGIAGTTEAAHWKGSGHHHSGNNDQFLSAEDSKAVLHHFKQIGYDFDGVLGDLQPVPRVYLAKMPSDLSEIEELGARKRLFFAAMLPASLQVNEEIRETRKRLSAIEACRQAGYAQAPPIQDWLTGLGKRYRTYGEASALLRKIAEIPPSLALAQAAFESGWGTSSPAQSINSLFGQYAVDQGVAAAKEKTAPRLASYDNILEAVRAYMHNLNTHQAYAGFRAQRLAMMEDGEPLDSLKLAEKLTSYSTRRNHYVRDIQRLIRRNNLTALDKVDLAHPNDEVAFLIERSERATTLR